VRAAATHRQEAVEQPRIAPALDDGLEHARAHLILAAVVRAARARAAVWHKSHERAAKRHLDKVCIREVARNARLHRRHESQEVRVPLE